MLDLGVLAQQGIMSLLRLFSTLHLKQLGNASLKVKMHHN